MLSKADNEFLTLTGPGTPMGDLLRRFWMPALLSEELPERARAKAEQWGAMAPHYVKMAKRLVGESIEHNLTEHLQLERHGIADSMATEDLRIGVAAFFDGEKAEFTGR